MIIKKKRIKSAEFLNELDLKNIKIGIQITEREYEKLGIKTFADGVVVEPSYLFGINCERNSLGYSYPDKSKPKEYKCVGVREWTLKDWGGHEHSGYSDIMRMVYPRINIKPTNIELILIKNKENKQFIIANLDLEQNKEYLKQTINMILEIFGFCEIFTNDLDLLDVGNKMKRCNWELLPPGIKAEIISKRNSKTQESKNKNKCFSQHRLDVLNSYKPVEIYEGINGFSGYYAYIFPNTCYLENGFYGNATYIIPKNNWKELSQLSKQELLNTKCVINKIIHTEDWEKELRNNMRQTEKMQ